MSKALQELYELIKTRKPLGPQEIAPLVKRIQELKAQRHAVLLTHNYQEQAVKRVADFLGDSFDLAVRAQQVNADWIVFCGVRFMAETAKLLNPSRRVILPESMAGCDLADSLCAQDLRDLKKKHPTAKVVMYINCNIDVKAQADAICTSANAVKVVEAMPADTVIFGPDKNLGAYVAKHSKKRILIWHGYCPIHEQMSRPLVEAAIAQHPQALVVVHPEVPPDVQELADEIMGTQSMIKFAAESPEKSFIIGTEIGLIERLQELYPEKNFYPIYKHKGCDESCACPFMKVTNLQSVLHALETGEEEINIPQQYQAPALRAVEKMLEIGK